MLSHNELKELYDFDLRASQRSFYEFHQSLRYYHGDQIDPVNLQTILERRQSPVIENIFKLIINKIIGYKAQSIAEIKVTGRQENDQPTALLINDILKVFSEDINYNKEIIKRDKSLIFGMGVCELWCERDKEGDFFLSLKSIEPLSFLIDAYSEDLNALDARRFHKKLNMSFDEAKRVLKTTPYIKNQRNFDQRCILIESWIKEGEDFARYIWQDEVLLSYEKKPFKNGMHPFIVSKFNIDEKGVWYGLFRDIKPLQDYINYSENKMMNMIGTLKAFFEEDSVFEVEQFIKDASLDNAVVKVRSGALRDNKLKFVEHHNDIATISAKANEKRNLAKMISGLNDEALGIANNRMSNDAISQRREAGLMGLQEYLNACDAMDRLIFKKAIDYISLYFTKKQVFQISDERVGQRYFSINDNENNRIKVGKFDLSYKSQIKTQSNEEKLASWAEIIKSFSHDPNLMSQMMLLMLKDVQSSQAKDLLELITQKQNEAQNEGQSLENQLNLENMKLELEKKKAEILELKAKTKKYSSQGDLAHGVAINQSAQNSILLENPKTLEQKGNASMQKAGQDLR
ncbi:portal protein [Campylobacter upsaliensis]|nr:portal protein [Campylobacter upsaliensis]